MKDREDSHFEGNILAPLFTFSLSETTTTHGGGCSNTTTERRDVKL